MDRKIFFTLAISLTISGFIVICTLGQSLRHKKIEAEAAKSVSRLEQAEITVREFNGKIGIFKGDGGKPYRIIDYNVNLLSDYDRRQLQEGIVMEDEEKLRIYLEDIVT